MACLVITGLITWFAVSELQFEFSHWPKQVYNFLISTTLGGSLLFAISCFPKFIPLSQRQHAMLAAFGISFLVFSLLGLLLIGFFVESDDNAFMEHLSHTRMFIAYGLLLLFFLFLPSWHIRLGQNANRQFWRRARQFQLSYDYCQVLVASFILSVLIVHDSTWLTEEIFAFCFGCLSIFNGVDLTQFKSSYFMALSDRDKAEFRYYVRAQTSEENKSASARILGVLSIIVGVSLLSLSLARMWQL